MSVFTYRNVKVSTPRYADIATQYRPQGVLAWAVQAMLDKTTPWEEGEDPIVTQRFESERIFPISINSTGYDIQWGIHRSHHATTPKLSPFILSNWYPRGNSLGYLTIELDGTPECPLLTRVYGGEYSPPLPWMASAKNADGGRGFCLGYWKTHAYLNRHGSLILQGSQTSEAPEWFTRTDM